jgi:two-component system response regulator GlrR
MRSDRALLLSFAAASEVCNTLQAILEPYFRLAVQVHPKPITDYHPAGFSQGLGKLIKQLNPSLVFLVLTPDLLSETKKLVKVAKKGAEDTPIIVVIEELKPNEVLELLKAGATDFISLPLKAFDVLARAWRHVQGHDSAKAQSQSLELQLSSSRLIGQSPEFREQIDKIPIIAKCEANVLIVGETGTGKELYARALHYCSPRADKAFIPVNCGAIPVDLVENELFGHARGAFTSASSYQVGLVDEARGGTLFMDEIDCLPLFAQIKLLRFLQEKEYRRLGSAKLQRANVRVIAASNLNLEEAVGNGKVRQDLFYRLNIISLTLPPLRDRREDIPLLAGHFLDKFSRKFNKQVVQFSAEAMQALMSHSWPGNVRELEHAIERAVVLSQGPVIELVDLGIFSAKSFGKRESLQAAKAKEIARFEKNYIKGVLSACEGNITKAAQLAEKNRRAFWQLIHKYEIDVARFKPGVS